MTLPDGCSLVLGPPSVEAYRRLRRESGLSPKDERQASAAIENSWSWRHVVAPDGVTVAMGRVIGDGGWYFHVADMATLPEHQGRGLGAAVLSSLLDDVRQRSAGTPYVTLVADPPGRRLYERFGFVAHADGQVGMSLTPAEPGAH